MRAAVALQIDAGHLPALRELGQVGTEHCSDTIVKIARQFSMPSGYRPAASIDGAPKY